MPRGLGDDPLSRQRKGSGNGRRANARAPSSSTIDAGSPDNPSSGRAIIDDQDVAEVSIASPQSASYNDVFFQRRQESNLGGGHTSPLDVIAQPTMSSLTEAVVVSESALVTISVTPIVPVQALSADSPEPHKGMDSEMAESVSILEESDAGQQGEAQSSHLEVHDSGFFQRIFGKFRKE